MAFKPSQLGPQAKTPVAPKTPPKQAAEAAKISDEKRSLEEERIYRKGVVSIKDLISPAGMKIESTYLVLNETYVRTVFVVNYPRYINLGWFAPIINLNWTLDVAMFFYPVKAEVILKQLRKKVGMLESQIMSDAEKGAPRDPISETALHDI